MKRGRVETRQMRTWYGVNATITIGPGFMHRVGLGNIVMPHPPMVNLFLRNGLEENKRYSLAFAHEFGHMQSAPGLLLYAVIMFALIIPRGYLGILRTTLILISLQAAWEIASEFIAFTSDIQSYRIGYQKVTLMPRLLFWLFMGGLVISGWIIL